MKMLDLFAGIGGFSLAAHWLGHKTIGFVEWDKYNQKVLAKNFPNTPVHGDITTYHGTLHEADIITGGFPCQPFSTAGKREGASDSRYLWPEMLRVIREVQPTYVIGENVAGIYSMDNGRVFEQVCADMENEGYAVQPFRVPACATGAPHRRDRWWFCAVKNADSPGNGGVPPRRESEKHGNAKSAVHVRAATNTPKEDAAQPYGKAKRRQARQSGERSEPAFAPNPEEKQLNGCRDSRYRRSGSPNNNLPSPYTGQAGLSWGQFLGAPDEGIGESQPHGPTPERNPHDGPGIGWHEVAARLCGVDDGLPAWVDRHRTNRLKSLGNTIQPQVAYEILKAMIP